MYQLWTEKFWESDEPRLCAVAALDGSWCTEQSYLWAGAVGPDRVVLMDQEYRLWFCDLEGNITLTAVDHPITDLWRILFPNSVSLTSVMELNWAPDEKGAWFVNLETGAEVYFENGGGSEWNRQGELFVLSTEDGYGYIDDQGNWILEPVYAWADDFYGSYGLVQRTHGGPFELIDATGQTVLSADGGVSAYLVNGSVYWIAADAEGRTVEIRDQNLQVVDLTVVGARNFYAENALAWCDEAGKKWYWDGTAVHAYPDDSLQLEDCQDGLALFRVLAEDAPAQTGLYDITEERWILPLAPRGHCFLYQSGGDVFLSADSTAIYDRSGKEIVSAPLISLPVEGVFQVIDGDWTGLVDRTGQWILRIPLETTQK